MMIFAWLTFGFLLLTSECDDRVESQRRLETRQNENNEYDIYILPTPKNAVINCFFFYGERICRATCNSSFHFPDQTVYKEIVSVKGVFKPSLKFPDCIPSITCDQPISPKNGKINCNPHTYFKECIATCSHGFQFPDKTSEKIITCTQNVFYPYSSFPDCEKILTCVEPASPKKGKIKCETSTNLVFCKATCEDGFHFPDKTRIKIISCTQGAFFPTSKFPDCQQIFTCGQPKSPKNGKLTNCNTLTDDKYCSAVCDENFIFPDGTSVIRIFCNQGEMSPASLPDCQQKLFHHSRTSPLPYKYSRTSPLPSKRHVDLLAKDCLPTALSNTEGRCYNTEFNSMKCIVKCRNGYQFSDGTTMEKAYECYSGYSSASRPICYPIPTIQPSTNGCKLPPQPKNGHIDCQKYSDNICYAQCNQGFIFPDDGISFKRLSCIKGVIYPARLLNCQPKSSLSKEGCIINISYMSNNFDFNCFGSPRTKCIVRCIRGYLFPDGSSSAIFTCSSGIWYPVENDFPPSGDFPQCQRAFTTVE